MELQEAVCLSWLRAEGQEIHGGVLWMGLLAGLHGVGLSLQSRDSRSWQGPLLGGGCAQALTCRNVLLSCLQQQGETMGECRGGCRRHCKAEECETEENVGKSSCWAVLEGRWWHIGHPERGRGC